MFVRTTGCGTESGFALRGMYQENPQGHQEDRGYRFQNLFQLISGPNFHESVIARLHVLVSDLSLNLGGRY